MSGDGNGAERSLPRLRAPRWRFAGALIVAMFANPTPAAAEEEDEEEAPPWHFDDEPGDYETTEGQCGGVCLAGAVVFGISYALSFVPVQERGGVVAIPYAGPWIGIASYEPHPCEGFCIRAPGDLALGLSGLGQLVGTFMVAGGLIAVPVAHADRDGAQLGVASVW